MKCKEYKDILKYELYQNRKLSLFSRVRIKFFQPNTNCIFLSRKMWYLYSKTNKIAKLRAKLIYLKILRKFGCCIFPSAKVGKGFHITHPCGIVLGNCTVGENFMLYQNCSIGSKKAGEGYPTIGNNVELCSNSVLIGNINVCDNVVIGAHSLVIKSILEPGTYAGNPIKKIK